MITFFDVTSSIPGKAWNATAWKTRFSLNFKGIPYKTHWLEYPEIAPVLESHGIPPYKTKEDGTLYYTVPAILDVDDETGAVKAKLLDSLAIAKYLDDAYPDAPGLLPSDKAALEEQEQLHATWLYGMLPTLILLGCGSVGLLNKESQEHFSRARAKDMYMYNVERLEDVPLTPEHRQELWTQAKASFDSFDALLKEKEAKNGGPWFAGDKPTFVDCMFGGYFMWAMKVFGEESKEWADIMEWNDGRWARLVERLKPYASVS
jgi:glutathione S-transferase